jgi:hypothetical protein
MSTILNRVQSLTREATGTVHGYGIRPFDRRLGALTVGNPNGLLPEVAGRAAVARARIGSDYAATEHRPESETLAERGYVDLGETFDEELVSRIRSAFDDLLGNETARLGWGPDGYDRTFVEAVGNELFEQVPEVARFVTPEVGQFVRDYYGAEFQVRQCYAYRNHHVPSEVTEEVYADHWHIDAQTSDHLKLFVNLTDVTEDDGPLHLVSREETRRLAREAVNWRRHEDGVPDRVVEPTADVKRFTGPAGSAMLANTYTTLHRAGIPAEGRTRDLFQFVLAPASDPLPYDWTTQQLGGVSPRHVRRLFEY